MTEKRRTLYYCWTMPLNMFLFWIITILEITNADRVLFSCNFESQCSQLNQEGRNDSFDWTLHSGATDQWFTGPNSDHTNGDDTGHYFYAKSDIDFVGTTAKLFTPVFDLTRRTVRLEFYYHMYDARYPDNMGTLNIYAHPCGSESLVFSRTGNQGFLWKKAEVDLQCDRNVQIRFEAVRGGTESDIAIDDVTLIDIFDSTGPVPTGETRPPPVFTDEPITEPFTVRTDRRTVRPPIIVTDPIRPSVRTQPPVVPVTTRRLPTPEHILTTAESNSEPPKSVPTPTDMNTKDRGSVPTTTGSTAIWGPPSKTLGDTAIIGAAVAVGVMCVLILILIVLVWKTRRGKNDDQRRGEMYENQAFNRSQDIHQCNHNDPAYTALNFPRGRSTASTIAAPDPPSRRQTSSKGKYAGLRKPGQYQDSSFTKHPMGVSTISTTRSACSVNSNDFGSTMEGHLGVYEAVPVHGKLRRSRRGRRSGGPGMPRRAKSEMLGNPVYIGGSEGDLHICSTRGSTRGSTSTFPTGRPPGPLEPKYYTVLPDVVDTLHYKVRVSKLQTLPSHARTWHVNDHYPASLSEDSDIEVGSKESVYADIEDTKSSLSDYSAGETVGNTVYGSYEIEC